jgi:hypothetical protein
MFQEKVSSLIVGGDQSLNFAPQQLVVAAGRCDEPRAFL